MNTHQQSIRPHKHTLFLAALAVGASAFCAHAEAQTSFLYSFTGSTAGTPTSTSNNTGNVSASAFSIGNTNGTVSAPISSSSASTGYTTASGVTASGGNNIGNAAFTGALNTSTSSYFAFTLTPTAGAGLAVQLSGLNFGERSTSTGAVTFALYSSADNYTTQIGSTVTVSNAAAWAAYSFPSFTYTAPTTDTAVTFHLYTYGGTGTASAGTINTRLDDITVIADGVTVPEPATLLGGALLIGATGWIQRRRLLGFLG